MSNYDKLSDLVDEAEALYNRLAIRSKTKRPLLRRVWKRWARRVERLEEYVQDRRFEIEIDRIYED